jgi:hypothetical protein
MKLLLDEHLPKAVAATLRRVRAGTEAYHVSEWENGQWLGEEDPVLLEGLWQDRRILASYDRATLPGYLAERIGEGKDHAGVIFVDPERFPVTGIGAMARALGKLLDKYPAPRDWVNRIVTLTT